MINDKLNQLKAPCSVAKLTRGISFFNKVVTYICQKQLTIVKFVPKKINFFFFKSSNFTPYKPVQCYFRLRIRLRLSGARPKKEANRRLLILPVKAG